MGENPYKSPKSRKEATEKRPNRFQSRVALAMAVMGLLMLCFGRFKELDREPTALPYVIGMAMILIGAVVELFKRG